MWLILIQNQLTRENSTKSMTFRELNCGSILTSAGTKSLHSDPSGSGFVSKHLFIHGNLEHQRREQRHTHTSIRSNLAPLTTKPPLVIRRTCALSSCMSDKSKTRLIRSSGLTLCSRKSQHSSPSPHIPFSCSTRTARPDRAAGT
jgi:hypothetical protein